MAATTPHPVMALSLDNSAVIIEPNSDTDNSTDDTLTSDLSFSFAYEHKVIVDRRFEFFQQAIFILTCVSLLISASMLFDNFFTTEMSRLNGHFFTSTSFMAVADLSTEDIEPTVVEQPIQEKAIITHSNTTTTSTTIKTPGAIAPVSTEIKADLDVIAEPKKQAIPSESVVSQPVVAVEPEKVSAALPTKIMAVPATVKKTIDWNGMKQQALTSNKPILLRFGAPWCTPCKIMEQTTFQNPILQAFMTDHYLTQKIDVSTEEGKALQNRYGIDQIPTLVFYSPQANILEEHQGTITSTKLLKKLGGHVGYQETIDINYLNNRPSAR